MATASVGRVPPERLSLAQARRVALGAQGFGRPALGRPVGLRDVTALTRRLGQLQIDSINVVTRAHFVPTFSRLGPYDPGLVERAAFRAPRRLFEYWGHAASLLDVELEPLLRFRMREGRTPGAGWTRWRGPTRSWSTSSVARSRNVAPSAPASSRSGTATAPASETSGVGTGRPSRRSWSGCSTSAR